jgi:predicted phage-related endonuclease
MLTPEQLIERRKGLGGSDAAKIVSGDWHALWLDKTNRSEPEDLSDVFAVQMGNTTEQLNLDWYGRRIGTHAVRRGEVVISAEYPFLRCTLDGFDETFQAVIQVKHVNAYAKIDEVRAKYAAQVMHESIVCGVTKGVLSVIIGTNEPVRELIELDDFWANEYIEKCREFWGYVERDEPPPQGAPVEAPPAPATMRVVSMEGNNAWASSAADWLEHKDAAKKFKASETDLKALVEADVRLAEGHGVKASRNKAGSLSIKGI